MNGFGRTLFGAAAGLALLFGAGSAVGDVITYNLLAGNTVGIGSGPFGTVSVTTNGTNQATVLFTANTLGGYAFVDANIADVNVSTINFTVGSFTGTDSPIRPGTSTVSLSSTGSGNVDGWGVFNVTTTNGNGFANPLETISFILTNTSGNWGSASTVLANNGKGNPVAAHVAFCSTYPTTTCTTLAAGSTGFATVPIPAAAWLFGSGLVGLIAIARRRIKGSDSPVLA